MVISQYHFDLRHADPGRQCKTAKDIQRLLLPRKQRVTHSTHSTHSAGPGASYRLALVGRGARFGNRANRNSADSAALRRKQAPLSIKQKFAFSNSSTAAAVAAGGSGLKASVDTDSH